ncbi:MAG: TraC family protein [Candidatus Gracilibacteria bacterium]|nr:TraC family protein [Candidatus Gracilibacteria bacterium]
MSVKPKNKPLSDSSTQRYLPFSQIRDNILLLKNDSSRIVLKCSTINFLLKSTQEQDAIIMSFQRFLNSLDFPIQIIIRSKKLDIDSYLNKLNSLAVNQENPLLQKQTYEYIQYLRKLIEVAQIMKKEFYIVIPADKQEDNSIRDMNIISKLKNFWSSINSQNEILNIKVQIKDLNQYKKTLNQRSNAIKTSLESIGIKAKELDKNELIKFLTDYYNPKNDSLNSIKGDIGDYNLI